MEQIKTWERLLDAPGAASFNLSMFLAVIHWLSPPPSLLAEERKKHTHTQTQHDLEEFPETEGWRYKIRLSAGLIFCYTFLSLFTSHPQSPKVKVVRQGCVFVN